MEAVVETSGRDLVYPGTTVNAGSSGIELRIDPRPFPMPIRLRIRVLLPDGSPLPGGRTRVQGFFNTFNGTIENGVGTLLNYAERPAPGQRWAWLLVSPDTARAAPTYVRIDLCDSSHEIGLDAGRTLTGKVMFDGEPVSVTITTEGMAWTPGGREATSDANGLFAFEGLPKGRVQLVPGAGERAESRSILSRADWYGAIFVHAAHGHGTVFDAKHAPLSVGWDNTVT